MRPYVDIAGHRFGMLTVVDLAGRDAQRFALWRCACDCGGSVIARGNDLRGGSRRSCGCMRPGTSERWLREKARIARGGAPYVPNVKTARLRRIRERAERRA
jgi:hypothetical protein